MNLMPVPLKHFHLSKFWKFIQLFHFLNLIINQFYLINRPSIQKSETNSGFIAKMKSGVSKTNWWSVFWLK